MTIGEMKHEMTLFHTMDNRKCFLPDTPSFCDHTYGLCGHLLTKDDADQLE